MAVLGGGAVSYERGTPAQLATGAIEGGMNVRFKALFVPGSG